MLRTFYVWSDYGSPDLSLNLGYVQSKAPKKRKLPMERSSIDTKNSEKNEETLNYVSPVSSTSITVDFKHSDSSPHGDLATCNDECANSESITNADYSSPSKKSNIYHDHSYCYGWKEMEKPEYCFKESCLGEKKAKDDEISNLTNELPKLK